MSPTPVKTRQPAQDEHSRSSDSNRATPTGTKDPPAIRSRSPSQDAKRVTVIFFRFCELCAPHAISCLLSNAGTSRESGIIQTSP